MDAFRQSHLQHRSATLGHVGGSHGSGGGNSPGSSAGVSPRVMSPLASPAASTAAYMQSPLAQGSILAPASPVSRPPVHRTKSGDPLSFKVFADSSPLASTSNLSSPAQTIIDAPEGYGPPRRSVTAGPSLWSSQGNLPPPPSPPTSDIWQRSTPVRGNSTSSDGGIWATSPNSLSFAAQAPPHRGPPARSKTLAVHEDIVSHDSILPESLQAAVAVTLEPEELEEAQSGTSQLRDSPLGSDEAHTSRFGFPLNRFRAPQRATTFDPERHLPRSRSRPSTGGSSSLSSTHEDDSPARTSPVTAEDSSAGSEVWSAAVQQQQKQYQQAQYPLQQQYQPPALPASGLPPFPTAATGPTAFGEAFTAPDINAQQAAAASYQQQSRPPSFPSYGQPAASMRPQQMGMPSSNGARSSGGWASLYSMGPGQSQLPSIPQQQQLPPHYVQQSPRPPTRPLGHRSSRSALQEEMWAAMASMDLAAQASPNIGAKAMQQASMPTRNPLPPQPQPSSAMMRPPALPRPPPQQQQQHQQYQQPGSHAPPLGPHHLHPHPHPHGHPQSHSHSHRPRGGHGHTRGPSSSSTVMPASAQRSALLDEFRSKRNLASSGPSSSAPRGAANAPSSPPSWTLDDIRGHIVEFCTDQHGSRFAQEQLDRAPRSQVDWVFSEVRPAARTLMQDVFGNYVVQKLFEYGTEEQRLSLAEEIQGHVVPLSLGTYGCRVIQKALDYLPERVRLEMAEELHGHVLELVQDQNANHVVQKLLSVIDSPSAVEFISQPFLGRVLTLGAHCYSCRVLQRIFERCGEAQARPLLEELHAGLEELMPNAYGNYVIQWILQKGQQRDKDRVVKAVMGNVVRWSRHKFASNVVEQVVRTASREQRRRLAEEILAEPSSSSSTGQADGSSSPAAVTMAEDPFANFVLQRFLEACDVDQKLRLVAVLQPRLAALRKRAVAAGGAPALPGDAAAAAGGWTKHLAAVQMKCDAIRPAGAAAPGMAAGLAR